MGKAKGTQKSKGFFEQVAEVFDRNKNLRADNPNGFTGEGDKSLADRINFGKHGSKPKSKSKK